MLCLQFARIADATVIDEKDFVGFIQFAEIFVHSGIIAISKTSIECQMKWLPQLINKMKFEMKQPTANDVIKFSQIFYSKIHFQFNCKQFLSLSIHISADFKWPQGGMTLVTRIGWPKLRGEMIELLIGRFLYVVFKQWSNKHLLYGMKCGKIRTKFILAFSLHCSYSPYTPSMYCIQRTGSIDFSCIYRFPCNFSSTFCTSKMYPFGRTFSLITDLFASTTVCDVIERFRAEKRH